MACCGRVTKKKQVVKALPVLQVKPSEDLEYIDVVYLGEASIKVTGCYTKNRYWFNQDAKHSMVRQDADCLFDNLPGMFLEDVEIVSNDFQEAVLEDVEVEISSDNSATEFEF